MNIRFKPLFTLAVNHTYYGGSCGDLDFVLPTATEAALRRGRLLARVREGRLNVLYEARDDGSAVADLVGTTLLIGLRQNNPYFVNFTAAPVAAGALPLFANGAAPATLDAPLAARFAPASLTVVPSLATRPVTLRFSAGGTVVASATLAAGEDAAAFATGDWPPGVYTLGEDYGGPPLVSTWLVEPDLAREGLWGVVAITVAAGFYGAAVAFELSLAARSERLKYYVVARNFAAGEFSQLHVDDAGFAEDGRPEVVFDTVLPAAFAAGDLSPDLLADASQRLVLFQSHDPVARRDRGMRKIQLSRNGEILVQHLPQPGADRARAQIIVHLSKP